MRRLLTWFNMIIKKQKKLKRWQRIMTALASVIIFATTYALILPAITVEKNTTEDVSGMYLDPVPGQENRLYTDASIPDGVIIAENQDNATTYTYEDENISATAVFSTTEEIPEDAFLIINNIDPESELCANLDSRVLTLLNKENITDFTSHCYYDFALISGDVDVTPHTGFADIQITFQNSTVDHTNDVVFAGRFASMPATYEEPMLETADEETVEEDGLVAMSTDNEEVTSSGIEENNNTGNEDDIVTDDELIYVNEDGTSVIELTDGIVTSLTVKGFQLPLDDTLVGFYAYPEEDGQVVDQVEDAELPDSDAQQETNDETDAAIPEDTSEKSETRKLVDNGEDYTVTLICDGSSEVPENAVLEVNEIPRDSEEYGKYLEEAKKAMGLTEEDVLPQYAARFFDIKIMVDGNEFTPKSSVKVEVNYVEPLAENSESEVNALHFAEKASEPEIIKPETADIRNDGTATVEFTADSFSVYGVIYTVDFEYFVNGKMFQFSLPGGGFVSFTDLVEVLGIISDTNSGENGDENGSVITENSEENAANEAIEEDGINSDTNTTLTLEDVEVSEATRKFVADVTSVEFSSPELVDVSKVENETTVGQIKESRGLECEYSAELTEEQIAEINAQTVEAGDWALISVQPFTSEETLTVTMKDGEVFTIRVTDASYTATKITDLDGKTGALVNNNGYNYTWLHNALQSSAHTTTYGRLNAIDVTITDGKIDTTSGSLTEWTFQKVEGTNDQYYISASENEYLNINSLGLFVTSNPQALVVQRDSNNRIRIHLGDTNSSGSNTAVNCVDNSTDNGYGTYKGNWTGNPGEWFDFYEVEEVFPVTLHFVKEDGTSFAEGEVTYADGTPVAYADGNFKVDPSKVVVGEDEIIDLSQFQINGYTLSNTHRGTWEDLLEGVSKPSYGANAQQPHSIIGNQLKWTDNQLQYRAYYTNNDKAGRGWINVGYRPGISDYTASGHPGTPVKDDIYDYYLVYSPLPTGSSSGGGSGSPSGNLEEVGKSKTLTSNHDGTYTMDLGVTTHAKGGEQSNGLNLIIVIDTSSSMISNDSTYNNQTKTRMDWTKPAVQEFVKGLYENNSTDPNKVQFALIDFNLKANEHKFNGSYWTTDGSENGVFNTAVGGLTTDSGTNWAQALELVRTIYSAEETDDDPTYVLFLTDGAPSQYWDPDNVDKFYVDGEGCYLGARDEARAVVNDGMILYGVFAFGSGDGNNPAQGTDKYYDYLGKLVDYAYNDDVKKTYRQYADDPEELKETLNNVFTGLKQTIAHTGVNYNDGIALDTTSTTLSNVSGPLGSITYSKTGGSGTPYTVIVDSTGKATFKIGENEPYTVIEVAQPTEITYTKISGSGENIQVNKNAKANVYQCTVGSGEEAVTYTMPIATLAINNTTKEGDLNWDLSPLGFLEDNATYKISFVVWPDQEAYDYVADLNNGKMQWNTSTQEAVYEADGTTVKYYKNGVAKYPNIVYDPTTQKYAALTNTKQEVTYYVGSESTGTSGEQTGYSGQYETHPAQPDPMPLEASLSKIEKQWNVDRDSRILAELLYGNKDDEGNWIPYSIRFGVHMDGKSEEYTSVTLGWETGWDPETHDYVWAEEPSITVPYGGTDHQIGTSWVKDFSIATGLMLSTERMNALGLDLNAYPKHFDYTDAEDNTVTYYILEDGHDYTLEESPKMGYEFDFESPVFHPMLVDGKLQSVTFTHSEPDSDHPQGIITGIEEITDEENGINSLKVQNTLRGYINLKKIVVDEDDERLTEDQTKFSYRIELQNSDDVFEGDHIPWYGVNRLFYHDDSFNYYQAYVDDSNNLKICTESGGLENPYDAVVGTVDSATGEFTPGGTFDPNNVIGQTLKFNDGSGDRIVTIKGNRTETTDEKNAWAEMKISQNETLSVANVPHGTTYTIKEKDSVGYKLDKIETNQSDDTTISLNDSSIEGTIVPNANNDVTFTNKVQRGNLKVTKELLGDVTGNENMEFKVTIKNSAGQYLQTDGSFADTEHEFTVSVSEPFEITGIPVDTYTVAEKTAEGDIAIAGYLWNGTESTTSGTGAVQNSQTATVELKNYYDEIYTPVPSNTNKTTDLVIDKDWVKADGSTAPAAGDTIKFKVKVKSADAYIPVDWKLYNGNGQLNEEQSGIYYVQNGANVTFTFDRFEQLKSSPGTSYWLNTNVPLTTGSGNTISPRNVIPHTSSGSGAWNQESKTITFATAVNGRVHVLAQPYGSGAKWVTTPSANGERSWSTSVTGGDYYTNVEAMRDALIDENATVENLVYVLNSTGVTLDENDTTCNIRPASATADNWVATLAALPTYQLIEDEDGNQSYKVYSYEITEIEVNGQTVTNNRTDDYIVSTSTSGETTTITNTEIKKVSVDATKSWQNADGSTNAPIGAAVTFELFANDEATGKTVVLDGVTREAEINADETLNAEEKVAAIAALNQEESGEFTAWKAEWKNLPQYSDDTQSALITYVVKEVSGLAGYTNQNPNGVSTGGIITNKQDAVDFDILKVAAGTTNTLEGASFTIQPVKENSNTTSPEYETGSSPSDPENTDAYGKASFTGITSGYYEVKETKTPDGYVITGDGTFYVKIDANGIKLLEKEVKDGKLSFKEATTTTVSNVTIDTQASTVTFTVENEPGAALPNTGGPGTRLFTILGSILILGAGVLLWRRRRTI